MVSGGDAGRLRLAEVVGSFSLATDLAMGQPLGHAQRTCLRALRLAEPRGLSDEQRREVYYVSLLRSAGCTAEAGLRAEYLGDELAVSSPLSLAQNGGVGDRVSSLWRYGEPTRNPLRRVRLTARAMQAMPSLTSTLARSASEVAERLAERLQVDPAVRTSLRSTFERWDGKGHPSSLKGEAIPLSVRLATLAGDALTSSRLRGQDATVQLIRQRAGHSYDPALVEAFAASADDLLQEMDEDAAWEQTLAAEPEPQSTLEGEALEGALHALAEFADLKSRFTVGHSSGVARLTRDAARRRGLPPESVQVAHRAGLLHDLGRVGVPLATWEQPRPLTNRQWEQVRSHPGHTERLLARPLPLALVAVVASHHHERDDGSGYPHGLASPDLSQAARILAAADAYHAMTEPRPHRPARPPDEAAAILRTEAHQGRFDADAVGAVLAAAADCAQATPRPTPADLTEPEVEVLRLLARGHSTHEMAFARSCSEKTIRYHQQRLYDKLAVTTRSGATLLAMQHELL
jgi:HD-GYP domain-containing protein (c-di-GMP phosphodiesterase class II)